MKKSLIAMIIYVCGAYFWLHRQLVLSLWDFKKNWSKSYNRNDLDFYISQYVMLFAMRKKKDFE